MDISSLHCLPELVNEDSSFIYQSHMSPLDHPSPQLPAAAFEADFQDSLSIEDYSSYFSSQGSTTLATFSCPTMEACHPGCFEGLTATMKTETHVQNYHTTNQVPAMGGEGSSLSFLSFSNEDLRRHDDLRLYRSCSTGAVETKDDMEILITHGKEYCWDFESLAFKGPERAKTGSNTDCCTQDHAAAERKRRERLTQHFIALSAIIPGLKKTDKASLIGGAIGYIKQLEAKVKTLEGKAVKRTVDESIVIDKKDGDPSGVSLLEIKARVSENTVLMRIHCEKRKGLLAMVISEVEKLHLTVMNTNAVPFASSSLNITIVAKIEEGLSMTLEDLEKNLKSAFSQFISPAVSNGSLG